MPPANLFRFITLYSLPSQIMIMALAALSLPVAYLTLELPKLIIDDAIKGTDFPRSFVGYEFGQIDYLKLLCALFLGLFVLSNMLKYASNVLRGVAGERMLRRLRYMLVERFLRLRRGDERHYSAGEVVQIVSAEVQPFGAFVGDAFATPMLQGGTLLVYLGFIFAQDLVLGLAAIVLFPVQGVLVPLMQRKVVRLTQARIANSRLMSEELAENVAGLETLRRHDAIRWRLAQIADRLYGEFRIRFDLFQQKFLIKFVNNIFNQVTPFAFYLLGGYFVIIGELQIGALVAVIAAFRDIASPWKELLTYYQAKVDVAARYASVLERFGFGVSEPEPPAPAPITGPTRLDFAPLTIEGVGRAATPDALEAGQSACVVGADERVRSRAIRAVAGLDEARAGAARLCKRDLAEMSFGERAAVVALVDREPFFFRGQIRENLALGLMRPQSATPPRVRDRSGLRLTLWLWRRRLRAFWRGVLTWRPSALVRAFQDFSLAGFWRRIALGGADEAAAEAPARPRVRARLRMPTAGLFAGGDDAATRGREAAATGNFQIAAGAPMVDYAAAGVDGAEALDRRMLELAAELDLTGVIFEAGLGAVIDPKASPELAASVLAMRAELRNGARESRRLDDVIEYWSPDRFNTNATIAENLLYAAPSDGLRTPLELAGDSEVESGLRRFGVEPMLIAIGAEIVEATADVLDALGGDASMLREFALYPPERANAYRAAALQARKREGARLSRAQRRMLIGVAFGFQPTRHRLSVLSAERRDAIVAARAKFADIGAGGRFLRFDADRYLPSQSLRGNALLGKLRRDRREHWSRIGAELWSLAVKTGAEEQIARLGLGVEMSPRESRFTPDQRLRLAIVRALLARPRLLLLDGPGGSESAQDQKLLGHARALKGEAVLIYASAARPSAESGDALIDLDAAQNG